MFWRKKKDDERRKFAEEQCKELEAIMKANPPESEAYKAAQISRENLLKELKEGPNELRNSLILEGIRVLEGLGLMAGGTLIESCGFLVPTRKFQELNIIDRLTHRASK